jgi:hypothetical protein
MLTEPVPFGRHSFPPGSITGLVEYVGSFYVNDGCLYFKTSLDQTSRIAVFMPNEVAAWDPFHEALIIDDSAILMGDIVSLGGSIVLEKHDTGLALIAPLPETCNADAIFRVKPGFKRVSDYLDAGTNSQPIEP